MLLRAGIVWIGLMVVAILNAGLREGVWTPRFGESAGHVISTVILCAAILLVAFLSVRWIGPTDARAAVLAGALWTALTLAFELLAGHYIFGSTWEKIFADYNVLRGRVWILVPLTTLLAPYLAFRKLG